MTYKYKLQQRTWQKLVMFVFPAASTTIDLNVPYHSHFSKQKRIWEAVWELSKLDISVQLEC